MLPLSTNTPSTTNIDNHLTHLNLDIITSPCPNVRTIVFDSTAFDSTTARGSRLFEHAIKKDGKLSFTPCVEAVIKRTTKVPPIVKQTRSKKPATIHLLLLPRSHALGTPIPRRHWQGFRLGPCFGRQEYTRQTYRIHVCQHILATHQTPTSRLASWTTT